MAGAVAGPFWRLSRGPSGDRIARSRRRTGPNLTVRIGVKDRIAKTAIIAICFGFLGPMIVCPEIKQKQPQDRKTSFETPSLPVAKIVSPVARQAPSKKPMIVS